MKKLICFAGVCAVLFTGCFQVFADELSSGFKNEYRNELDNSNHGIQADNRAITEQRNYEYQTAKNVIDMHGYRVRMEQFLSRPNSNQLRVDVYNNREHRIDTMYGIDTYNQNLPARLSEIVKQGGGDGPVYATRPNWYVTDRQVHMENDAGDYCDSTRSGGKIYEMKNDYNGTYYSLLYDREQTSISGIDKIRIDRYENNASAVNGTGYAKFYFPNLTHDLTLGYDSKIGYFDPNIFPTINHYPALNELLVKVWLRQPIDLHESTKLTFADGTSLKFEQAWVRDDGKIVNTADLIRLAIGVYQGQDWRPTVKQWNIEGIVTASEWDGRDIDVMWSPQDFLTQIVSEKEGTN